MTIHEEDMIRLGRRIGNLHRSYVLVNPVQGKHLAVSSSRALELSHQLGDTIRRSAPETSIVIGFAETATAVGAGAASRLRRDAMYVQTTRETQRAPHSARLDFTEDHSHACMQSLFASRLLGALKNSAAVAIVDDEISTGKTCLHLIEAIRSACPDPLQRVILASLISRIGASNRQNVQNAGVEPISLLELEESDYESVAAKMSVKEAGIPSGEALRGYALLHAQPIPDPRFGVVVGEYEDAIQDFCETIGRRLTVELKPARDCILVLGTEECMYPAIRLGAYLEEAGAGIVWTHATTRSPIGISEEPSYPIHSGFRLTSFYASDRETYLYNPQAYGLTVVVTDAAGDVNQAMEDIERVFAPLGCEDFALVQIPTVKRR